MKLEDILKAPQMVLKKELASALKSAGYKNVYTPKGFVYAQGSIPVLLVAHIDTVHRSPVKTICYSKDGNIIMSPQGIGGDDRAGVYMILQITKEQKCHVLFCEDEEVGGIGAKIFAHSRHKPNVNYIIEFDRRGGNDAVFYGCDNEDFTRFIRSFGFTEEFGSFSDISVIAPKLGIAAVNLSAGYYHEHQRHEYINLSEVHNNIKRAKEIVSTETGLFEYIERISLYDLHNFRQYFSGEYGSIYDEMDLWDEEGFLEEFSENGGK